MQRPCALLRHVAPQPLVALATGACGLVLTAGTWHAVASPLGQGSLSTLLLALFLGASVTSTFRFPVHVTYHTKVLLSSTALFLLAVLLPPVSAALVGGIALLVGEVLTQPQKGTYPSDIATAVARYLPVILLTSLVAHASLGHLPVPVLQMAAAAVMFGADMLTVPLLLGPMVAERPLPLILHTTRESGLAEGSQYLLGLLGALAADQNLWALTLLTLPTVMVYLAFKNAKEMHDGTRQVLESMADTVDLRDPYTGGHSRRVTDYCAAILKELQLTGHDVRLIIAAARVHDIGKIAIPDRVLNKEGKLDEEEWAIMRSHSERGADVLTRYPDFARGVAIVRHHHEAWDGSGYPHRLAGTDIPFGARVIAVADSYDAMTSDRPYRRGMPQTKAAAILREGRGKQWDAQIVDAFLASVERTAQPERPGLHLVPHAAAS